MKGPTRITRRTEQTTISSQANSTQSKNKPSTQMTSYTTSRRNNQNNTSQNNAIFNDSKRAENRSHAPKLTAEERKKFSRGIRASAAQRERAKIENMNPKEREKMIEIIDATNYSDKNTGKVRLKPNIKINLINKKRIITSINENQGLRKNEPISNFRNTREKTNILSSSQSKTTPIIYNQRNNQDVKTSENKKVINKNQKYTTVTDLPNNKILQYGSNNRANSNIKNTGRFPIDETKKEPKKEVLVQPRNNIIIKNRITHNLTETNKDNLTKTYDKQNLYDKNKNKDKNKNDKDNKNNRQNISYQPRVRNENNTQNKNKNENKYQIYKNNNVNNDKNANDSKYINRRGNNQPQNRSTGVIQQINKEERKGPESNLLNGIRKEGSKNSYNFKLDKEKALPNKREGHIYESKYTRISTTIKEQTKPKQPIINISKYTRTRPDK